jgi:hypothetical protein
MPKKKQPSIAVKRALEQAPSGNSPKSSKSVYQSIPVKLTNAQSKKLDELSRKLALAKRFLLDFAIRYAIIYAQMKQQPVETLRGFPKRFGNTPIDVELTADTFLLLSENKFMEKSKELVVFGLKLLHERLLCVK